MAVNEEQMNEPVFSMCLEALRRYFLVKILHF